MLHKLLVLTALASIDRAASVRSISFASDKALALEQQWSKELDSESKETPIQRVVRLLTEMKDQLEKEADKDNELYDQMVCWCETNEKEKIAAIAGANNKDEDLTAEIEERAARFAVIGTEIEATKKLITEETEALAKATELREKEYAQFTEEEKDMIQAVTNLKNAIQVLSRVHGGSLLQVTPQVMTSLRAVFQDAAYKHELLLGDDPSAQYKRASTQAAFLSMQEGQGAVAARLRGLQNALDVNSKGPASSLPLDIASKVLAQTAAQGGSGSFVQQKSQQAQKDLQPSAAIFGMLKQLKDDFESELSTAQKEEVQAQADFAGLKATKEEAIAAAKAKLEALQQEDAENKKALYDAKEDIGATREQRKADVDFLANLKVTCQGLDKQFADRTKTRGEEITAVSEAIKIITDDDAKDLLAKTVTFLQVSWASNANAAEHAARTNAAATLRRVLQAPEFDDLLDAWKERGTKDVATLETPKAQLSTLVVSVQLDAFKKVIEAMDKMVAELKGQQEEEVKLKEFCTTEFNQNAQNTLMKTEEKEDLEMKIAKLTSLMEQLTKEIGEAEEQITTSKKEIKKASEAREKENAEFQQTIADQRATQAILDKALKKLESFYKKSLLQKNEGAALLQKKQGAVQTPPVQFAPTKKSSGASPVLGLIEQIIEESKAVEKEAVTGEASAQADYEKFVTDSNNLIDQLTAAIEEKTKGKAEADMEKSQTETALQNTEGELSDLSSYKADLHDQCDFVLKNFDVRQKARRLEMEAIQKAKAILSGMQ